MTDWTGRNPDAKTAAHELALKFPDFTVGRGNDALVLYAHTRRDMKRADIPTSFMGYAVRLTYLGKVRPADG